MRTARLAAYAFGGAAALGAAVYLVIYLYRWQWQRTLICGVLLLIVEVLLLGLAALDRLGRLEARMRDGDRRQEEILAQLRAADRAAEAERRPGAGGPRFAWLDGDHSRTFVFVPVLMVTGVVLSGLAWVVERIARATVRPTARRRLAGRLAPLAAPPGGPWTGGDPPDLPPRPGLGAGPPRRRLLRAGAATVAVALAAGLFLGLSAMTATKPPERGGDTATSVLFTVDGRGVDGRRAALAAHQVWERCRDATAVPLLQAGLAELDDGLYAATVHPSLSAHDEHRLLGCLQDTTVDRARLSVLGTGAVNAADAP
ncbi:hypothetical protein [Streptomyces sp. MP131-18]|uniref:hypothetical protein n=1 Tax=Streptomyces sp. MP131-18 TaxID=1857892 RepID=UPI00097C12D9|nr:hypothetical protein [Streptomyces sp. MP131-18]ONK14017.1 hypothetical protein STBA_47950 [Streptomyces sp. MP131-18]